MLDEAGHISQYDRSIRSSLEKRRGREYAPSGYGKFGINKSVKKAEDKGSGLDAFLKKGSSGKEKNRKKSNQIQEVLPYPSIPDSRINALEEKMSDLARQFENLKDDQAHGVLELKTTLRGLDVNEKHIQEITRRASVELSPQELSDSEITYEFMLREMLSSINVAMPLFSRVDADSTPVVTVLLSQSSCGQSSTIRKLAALKKESVIVEGGLKKGPDLAKKIYNIESFHVSSFSEIIGKTRESTERGKTVFIDYKDAHNETNDIKKNHRRVEEII